MGGGRSARSHLADPTADVPPVVTAVVIKSCEEALKGLGQERLRLFRCPSLAPKHLRADTAQRLCSVDTALRVPLLRVLLNLSGRGEEKTRMTYQGMVIVITGPSPCFSPPCCFPSSLDPHPPLLPTVSTSHSHVPLPSSPCCVPLSPGCRLNLPPCVALAGAT